MTEQIKYFDSSDRSHYVVSVEHINALICDICAALFVNPYILNCSHTYCRTCLEMHYQRQEDNLQSKSCPYCRTKVPEGRPYGTLNRQIVNIISSLVIKCDYGCGAEFPLIDRSLHLAICGSAVCERCKFLINEFPVHHCDFLLEQARIAKDIEDRQVATKNPNQAIELAEQPAGPSNKAINQIDSPSHEATNQMADQSTDSTNQIAGPSIDYTNQIAGPSHENINQIVGPYIDATNQIAVRSREEVHIPIGQQIDVQIRSTRVLFSEIKRRLDNAFIGITDPQIVDFATNLFGHKDCKKNFFGDSQERVINLPNGRRLKVTKGNLGGLPLTFNKLASYVGYRNRQLLNVSELIGPVKPSLYNDIKIREPLDGESRVEIETDPSWPYYFHHGVHFLFAESDDNIKLLIYAAIIAMDLVFVNYSDNRLRNRTAFRDANDLIVSRVRQSAFADLLQTAGPQVNDFINANRPVITANISRICFKFRNRYY